MGYLNNSSITVDAILTKKGRELLARGRDEFKITHFALADDEVDYDLYNTEHPLGTAYYGAAIENMPVVEALADETQKRFNQANKGIKIAENVAKTGLKESLNLAGTYYGKPDAGTQIFNAAETLNAINNKDPIGAVVHGSGLFTQVSIEKINDAEKLKKTLLLN